MWWLAVGSANTLSEYLFSISLHNNNLRKPETKHYYSNTTVKICDEKVMSKTLACLNFYSLFCKAKDQTMFCYSTSKSQIMSQIKRLKTIES